MLSVLQYHDRGGLSPFRMWLGNLNAEATSRVMTAVYRMGLGNFSNTKAVGAGVFEFKVNFGPGYRIYFGRDGAEIVILLGGGTKQRQNEDIRAAHACWQDYKARKTPRKER